MLTKSEPTTWRILPTTDGHYQWAVTTGDACSRSEDTLKTLAPEADEDPRPRLSSMTDLLLQAEQITSFPNRSCCLEQNVADPNSEGVRGGGDCSSAMFSTGNGRTLSIRESSIRKAKSLLEGQNDADKAFAASCSSECFPMFRTGSGKTVQVRHSSIKKASVLLEGTDDTQNCNMHEVLDNKSSCPLKFHTAHGRSISISVDALHRARTLLNDPGLVDPGLVDHGLVDLDSEIKANEQAYPIRENEKINYKASNKLKDVFFDTPHMSSSLNINVEIPSSLKQFFCPLMAPITSSTLSKQVDSKQDHLSSNNGDLMDFGLPENSLCYDTFADHNMHEVPDKKSTCSPPMEFHTAGGRSISISSNSLKRARSLFNDPGSENLDSEVKANKLAYPTCQNNEVNHKACSKMKKVSLDSPCKVNFLNRNILDIPSYVKQISCPLMTPISSSALSKQVDSKQDHLSSNIGDSKDFGLPDNSVCKETIAYHDMHEVQDKKSSCPPMKFHTAGGRSISISADSLKRARILLNDPGSENFDSEVKANGLVYSISPNDEANYNSNIKKVPFDSSHNGSFVYKSILEIPSSVMEKCCPLMTPKQVDSKQDHLSSSSGHLKDFGLQENSVCKDAVADHSIHEVQDKKSTYPPMKFHTAGGRSISISTDSLKRARTLFNDQGLEDLDSKVKENELAYSTCENEKVNYDAFSNIKTVSFDSSHVSRNMNKNILVIPSSVTQFCCPLMESIPYNLLSEQDDPKQNHLLSSNSSCSKPPNEDFPVVRGEVPCSGMIPKNKSASRPLVDISNYTGSDFRNKIPPNGEKLKPGKGSSSSSFKRPRTSSSPVLAKTAPPSTSVNCYFRTRVSFRYPFSFHRKKLKEFFGRPSVQFSTLENVTEGARYMTADNAKNYRFCRTCSPIDLGPEDFQGMLLHSGALLGDTSIKWVVNHYKWIVWKLSCLERCYSSQAIIKFLTVGNVLEELKYRYEREFNYGHRSALKKILEGDIPPSSMMILCVSAIRSCRGPGTDKVLSSSDLPGDGKELISFDSSYAINIELTDGWYSLDATLDLHLSKQVIAGKLFVGQKLRIYGASLCGWVEPISPLEASMVYLVLHINGTFRAQWSDSLGLCKGLGTPLAFKCIKGGGGRVPRTLVGISRLYPVLYKERLQDGRSIVRSKSMENLILHLNNQRRRDIAEAIISELEDDPVNINDSEEGAKIFRILESSAEPDILMAGMSSEQLISISNYQAKREALRQANLHKKIDKAFEEAGLGSRDVTPFMRVRVTGLISKRSFWKGRPREGLITIWNPTEKQKLDLVEGQIYSVSSLTPLSGSSDYLYLHARGPSSEWICLPSTDYNKFKPFFISRESVSLSNLGDVPLTSEFDISAVVVHVGKVYESGCQRKQWIFVTDESGGTHNESGENHHDDSLLAISFRSPIFGSDSIAPINQRILGCTVGFCNLIKRARDQNNSLWVADATEYSTYSVYYNIPCGSHLKKAADSASKWAKTSSLALQKLKKRVLCITGDDGI